MVQLASLFVVFTWWEGRRPFVPVPPKAVLLRQQESRQISNVLLLAINRCAGGASQWLLVWLFAISEASPLIDLAIAPGWVQLIIGLLLLDLIGYARHRLFHWGWFWRVHRVHHCDESMDWTTEFRFHPIEALLSTLLTMLVVWLFGLSSQAVLLYAFVIVPLGCWQHSNVEGPAKIAKLLAPWLVTPSFHRVHHSIGESQHHQNFGVLLPWWDRLVGCYQRPNQERIFGVPGISPQSSAGILRLLLLPWRRQL